MENSNLQNLDGLKNLESVGRSLAIVENFKIQTLDGLSNLFSIGNNLTIVDNQNLTNCCGIKILLRNPDAIGGNVTLADNPFECSSQNEILRFDCENLSPVKGCMYWDENQNGKKDEEETSAPFINSAIDPGNIITFLDSDGCFTHFFENGNYMLAYVPSPFWQLSSDSTQYNVTVNNNNQAGFDFGFVPTDNILNGDAHVSGGIPRCFREVEFDFNFRNEGTTILSGIMWGHAHDEWMELLDYVQAPDTIDVTATGTRWGWVYEGLYPGELIQKSAILQMPEINEDGFVFGDSFLVSLNIEAISHLGEVKNFGFRLEEEIVCAYDPNDKLVSPNREGDENFTLFDEDLTYTIRFQNTGNDTAFTVVIRDTLDKNLDVSSLNILASSHQPSLRAEISDGQFMAFTFNDIMLPDSSVNFEGSQGYVTYTIQPKEGLDENTIIENTASIFFDFNPPIVTNTTQNTMVSCLPTIPIIQYDTIYEVNTYELIDGTIVNESGSYTSSFIDQKGCDTLVVITELEVLECPSPNQNEINVQIAIGETHTLPDGMVVSDAGTYTTELLDEVGCPSEIIVTHLDVLTSIGNLPLDEFVSIFPNPTKTHFDLDIKTLDAIQHELVLVNVYGQEVLIKEVHLSLTKVDVTHLDSGVYFVHLRNASNELVAARKLMILK